MTDLWFLAFVAAPALVVAIAYVGLRLHENAAPKDRLHAGE